LENLFTGLISSKTRIKLLIRFFFNPNTRSYLRELAKEFNVSTNDQVVDGIVTRLGDLESAYLLDDYAEGKDTGIIDLLLVGNIDQYHLNDLSRKTERYIKRKIRSLVLSRDEFKAFEPKLKKIPNILIWEAKK